MLNRKVSKETSSTAYELACIAQDLGSPVVQQVPPRQRFGRVPTGSTHTHIYIYILWIYHDQDHLHQYTVDVPNIDSNLEYIEHCISWFLCPIDMYWQPGRLCKKADYKVKRSLAPSSLIWPDQLAVCIPYGFLGALYPSIYLSILF